MSKILYEPFSERDDHGVWVLTYGQPIKTPIYFDWAGVTAEGDEIPVEIDTSCRVIAKIKADMRDRDAVLEYSIPMYENNCIFFEMGEEDMLVMKPEKIYHLGMTLYDANGKVIRVLLRDLPIKIEGSMLRV